MFNEEDMILPEGFDPELGDQNFTDNGELVDMPIAQTTEGEVGQQTAEDEEDGRIISPETLTEGTEGVVTEPSTEPAPQTLKVRFNHEDRELSMDEATVYAQKGMNYDRIEQRSKEQEAKLTKYESMAKMFGFESAEAMMSQAKDNYINVKIQELVNQGNSEAMARFLVQQEMKEQNANVQSEPATQETEAPVIRGVSPEIKEQIKEFSAAYPDVTKIPDEVFKMHTEGVRLKTAYAIWEKQNSMEKVQAEKQAALNELAILKQNQAAAAKGPVTGTVGIAPPAKDEPEDPFLKGFNLDY